AGQKPSASPRISEQSSNAQNRYTPESASSILASFGLSNEDLEELSRYPDDQLTPENMPLILREIRIRKMGHPQGRGEDTLGGTSGAAVKSKVIDYGHSSKYSYTEEPLEVHPYAPEALPGDPLEARVYNPEAASGENREDFQREQNVSMGVPPSSVTCNPVFPVEDLIKPTGFQNDSSNPRPFFPAEAPGKVSGMCAPPAGLPVVKSVSQPAVLPIMPPMMPPLAQPMMPPVMPPLVQQSLPQHVMPPLSHPPFSPGLLAAMSQHERTQREPGPSPSKGPSSSGGGGGGQKPFQTQPEEVFKSPFGVVKASWLPVFSQSDAQKIKRLPTPSMMNDYYATSPRIFPHVCSLCNIECTHMKDWILHQNTPPHIESCRQLRQQYPDWNPESHSSKRNDRKENQTPKRRSSSASPGPRRSRPSGSAYAPRRSRSRSPGRFRPARPRSRSPRQVRRLSPRLSPRHRSRSPQRSRNALRTNPRPQRSSSSDWSRRATRSQDRKAALEAVVKSLGPGFVAEFNKHKSLQGSSGSGKSPLSHGPVKTPGNVRKPLKTSGGSKASKKDVPPGSGSSPDADDSPQSKEMGEDEDNVSAGTSAPHATPSSRVSSRLFLHLKGFAFLEMNYKEAVIAAVKYGKTVPVLVNGRRVKISVAEKPKAS
ncbi:ZN638 protein, partial [Podargus strigoides]|nr:ZN638 protein [Podargus strigoides]